MKDDYLLHLESDNLTLEADASASRPGTQVVLAGGQNQLTITSSGNAKNDRALKANDVEVVNKNTLRQLAAGILNENGVGLTYTATDTMKFVGQGIMESPFEALPSLPAGSETGLGIVKVVHEGSHGYPCPGISDRTIAGVYDPVAKTLIVLRNGADDLEKDVFIAYYHTDTLTWAPTADRFRLPTLPATAKPLNSVCSGNGVILLNTTDGLFALLTNESIDWRTWRAVKLTVSDPNNVFPDPGTSGVATWFCIHAFIRNGTLYVVRSVLSDSSHWLCLWSGSVNTTAITVTPRTLTGTNGNGTYQNSTMFYMFDAIWGRAGAKCMGYNADGYWNGVDTAHAGDDVDWVVDGPNVRACHDGYNYAYRAGSDMTSRHNVSYHFNCETGAVVFDHPGMHPLPFTRDGWPHSPHRPLLNATGGNDRFMTIRSNGGIFGFHTYEIYQDPGLVYARNVSGVSDYDSIIAGGNNYEVIHHPIANGAYGGAVRMGWGACQWIDDSVVVGITPSNIPTKCRVDPYGSYGPTVKGYGPTNDRVNIPFGDYVKMHNMISVYDGESIVLEGAILSRYALSQYLKYTIDKGFEIPISISKAALDAYTAAAVAKFCPGLNIDDVAAQLMIHRKPGLPYLGTLQVSYYATAVQRYCVNYLFYITPDVTVGEIKNITVGSLIHSFTSQTNMRVNGISVSDYIYQVTGAHIYRLDDGNYVLALHSIGESFVGNAHIPQHWIVYNGKLSKLMHSNWRINHGYLRDGMYYSKEFGWGYMYQSGSGESYYLDSYGKTTDAVIRGSLGQVAGVRHTIMMSRTDAGDNVSISQFAGTKIKNKVVSLIAPSRTVQGMDLTQDRTITRAMIPNADQVPNVSDVNYPVQAKHRDNLTNKVKPQHLHVPEDYVTLHMTNGSYGTGQLGQLNGADYEPVSAAALADLRNPAAKLSLRTASYRILDPTMQYDVEL